MVGWVNYFFTFDHLDWRFQPQRQPFTSYSLIGSLDDSSNLFIMIITCFKGHMAVHVDDNPAIDEADLSRRSFTNIFSRFCQSSTIHGTYFWSEARSPYLRFIWILIVGMVRTGPNLIIFRKQIMFFLLLEFNY